MAILPFNLASASRTVSFQMDDCDGLDHVVALAQNHGLAGYEEPYPALVAGIVRALPGDVLDVGANTGLFTLLAAACRPDITVHAFEPLLSIRQRLQANIAINPKLASSIAVHAVALSDRNGEAVFFETINPHGLLTTSSGLDATFARQHGTTREHRVPAATLDSWIAANAIHEVSFIKLDVEGHEQAVLTGASDAVQLLRPITGIELLGGADFEFFAAFLEENDYFDCEMTQSSLAIGREPRFVPAGWNHLFVPVERLALIAHVATTIGLAVHEG